MKKPLIIFGAGGHGASIIDTARLCGEQVDHCVDDNPGVEEVLGVRVQAAKTLHWPAAFRFVVAIGECRPRRRIYLDLLQRGGIPLTLVHPAAFVSPNAIVGRGAVVLAKCAIDPRVTLGDNVLVNIGAIIGHDSLVEAHAHVSGNVSLAGATHVGEGAWVGIHSCTIQSVSIGAWSYIGAGSIVTRDIPPETLAHGNPAHHNMRPLQESEDLPEL